MNTKYKIIVTLYLLTSVCYGESTVHIGEPYRLDTPILKPYSSGQEGYKQITGEESLFLLSNLKDEGVWSRGDAAILGLDGQHIKQLILPINKSEVDAYTAAYAENTYVIFWTQLEPDESAAHLYALRVNENGEMIDTEPVRINSVFNTSVGGNEVLVNNAVPFEDKIIFNASSYPKSITPWDEGWSFTYVYDVITGSITQNFVEIDLPVVKMWGENGKYLSLHQYKKPWGEPTMERYLAVYELEYPEWGVGWHVDLASEIHVPEDQATQAILLDDVWFVAPEIQAYVGFDPPPIELSRITTSGQVLTPVTLDEEPDWVPSQLWLGKMDQEKILAIWPVPKGYQATRINKDGFKADGAGFEITGDLLVDHALPGMFVDGDTVVVSGAMKMMIFHSIHLFLMWR
jgi:hypothetical protein